MTEAWNRGPYSSTSDWSGWLLMALAILFFAATVALEGARIAGH